MPLVNGLNFFFLFMSFNPYKIKRFLSISSNRERTVGTKIGWVHSHKGLDATMPVERETREVFCARLRRSVLWMNSNQRDALLAMSLNQKKRARDVLASTPPGARTKW